MELKSKGQRQGVTEIANAFPVASPTTGSRLESRTLRYVQDFLQQTLFHNFLDYSVFLAMLFVS